MENNSSAKYWRTIGSLFMAISVIVAAALISGAWKKSHPTNENIISVTGLGNQDFESDLIVWSGSFSQNAPAMKDAYEKLKSNAAAIRAYLVSKGVKPEETVFGAVDISRNYRDVYNAAGKKTGEEFAGFTLKQSVTVSSHEVDKIEGVSRAVTELIDQGVEFYSDAPLYYYTKLAELKIQMLQTATKDARTRAEKITENAKSGLGHLRNATMGVFQITAQNSAEAFSYGGSFNTTSKWKTASITVKLEFGID